MANRPGMDAEMSCLVLNSLTTEDFENGWKAMLKKYNAEINAVLDKIYVGASLLQRCVLPIYTFLRRL